MATQAGYDAVETGDGHTQFTLPEGCVNVQGTLYFNRHTQARRLLKAVTPHDIGLHDSYNKNSLENRAKNPLMREADIMQNFAAINNCRGFADNWWGVQARRLCGGLQRGQHVRVQVPNTIRRRDAALVCPSTQKRSRTNPMLFLKLYGELWLKKTRARKVEK